MLSQGSFLNLNLVWGLSWVPDITYPKKARAMFVPLTAGGKMLGSIKMGKQKRLESTSWNLVYCAAVFSNREKLNGSCFANGPILYCLSKSFATFGEAPARACSTTDSCNRFPESFAAAFEWRRVRYRTCSKKQESSSWLLFFFCENGCVLI